MHSPTSLQGRNRRRFRETQSCEYCPSHTSFSCCQKACPPRQTCVSSGAQTHDGDRESTCLLTPRAPEFLVGASIPHIGDEGHGAAPPCTRPLALMQCCPLTCILRPKSLRTPSPGGAVTSEGLQQGSSPSAGEAKASGHLLATHHWWVVGHGGH